MEKKGKLTTQSQIKMMSGHYIGNFLQVTTKSKKWWGEGDTDFIIDGDTIKNTPGTEDEFGAC